MLNKKEESKNEVPYEELEFNGIKLVDIKKVDKLGNGMYKVSLKDGTQQDESFDDGSYFIIEHYLNRYLESDELASDVQPSVEGDLPDFNRNALERELGRSMDVDFASPDIVGMWSSDEELRGYLNIGYTYAERHHIRDFEGTFCHRKAGESFSPGAPIKVNGLTLLVARKKVADKRLEFYQNKVKDQVPERNQVIRFKS